VAILLKSWESYLSDPDPVSIQRRAEAEVPLEKVYEDWAIGTDPQVHADKLLRLYEAGIDKVFVHSPQADQRRVILFYKEKVIPLIQRSEQRAGSIRTSS
jgi:F420-dependent hydroxymycolic acid dehydrogenase